MSSPTNKNVEKHQMSRFESSRIVISPVTIPVDALRVVDKSLIYILK